MQRIKRHVAAWFAACIAIAAIGTLWASADPHPAPKVNRLPLLKGAAKFSKVLPGVETIWSVVDALDEATRRDYATISRVLEVGFEGRSRIVTGTVKTQVTEEKLQDNLRGAVSVKIQMPAEATVAIEMESLWGCMDYNQATKTIEIALPPLRIIAVETYPHKAEIFPEYSGWCRFGFWDSGVTSELERSLLKTTDWGQRVRDEVNPNAYHLRAAAAHEVRTFVRRVIEPANPGIKVEVQP